MASGTMRTVQEKLRAAEELRGQPRWRVLRVDRTGTGVDRRRRWRPDVGLPLDLHDVLDPWSELQDRLDIGGIWRESAGEATALLPRLGLSERGGIGAA